jgi:hypothetical protein
MTNNHDFFITHIIVPELPDEGYEQVFFYTATGKSYDQGKYFWGTDNNSLDQEFIDRLVREKSVFRLNVTPYPLKLDNDKTIWIDSYGEIYLADLHEPTKNLEKLPTQQILKELAAGSIYNRSTEKIKDWPPIISKATQIVQF